jgi:hypothetical protein
VCEYETDQATEASNPGEASRPRTKETQLLHVVLIETSGNQNYIFATNKLRENVGASQLTYDAGTTYLQEAIDGVAGVQVIVSVSGKAILLVPDEKGSKRIVQKVTLKALKEAPGLDVPGVVDSKPFDIATDSLHARIRDAHRELDRLRARLSGPAMRFLRLPIAAECATSGLPAARLADEQDELPKGEHGPRSRQSLAKLLASQRWPQRLQNLLEEHQVSDKLANATTELEKLGSEWLAVVHADGNGLGQVFLDFYERVSPTFESDPNQHNHNYIRALRCFSDALDRCTRKAFCTALPRRGKVLPIVPLVLGGDDLTVVLDGRMALKFTKAFMDAFESETRQDPAITGIMPGGVTTCAGIAIVKPHFPFHAAYELAEGLLKEAKAFAKDLSRKRPPFSALDFHILYDASGPDLERIRAELEVDAGMTRLVARPYATTPGVETPQRHWDDLEQRVTAIRARDADHRRRLPNSMLHELREGLFFGRQEAEDRLGLVRERYRNQPLKPQVPDIDWLLVDGKLFWEEKGVHRTALLDALDVAEFWEGQQ